LLQKILSGRKSFGMVAFKEKTAGMLRFTHGNVGK